MAYIYASSNVTGDPETPPSAAGDSDTSADPIKPPTVADSEEDEAESEAAEE